MKFNRRNIIVITAGSLTFMALLAILLIIGTRINTRIIPTGSIELTTKYKQYLLGEEITFKIHNNFNSAIYVENNCPAEPLDVYRYEGKKWVRQHDKASNKVCKKSDRKVSIPANGSQEYSFSNWPNLFNKPGLYRIVAYVDYYNQLPYQDFEVIEKPKVPQAPAGQSSSSPASSTSSTSQTNRTVTENEEENTTPPTTPPTTTTNRTAKSISVAEGTINIEYTNNYIYVISVIPASGYWYEGGHSGAQVETTFKNGSNEVQVQLRVVNGQIVQQVEN